MSRPYVIVLDEIDHLDIEDTFALYDLYEVPWISLLLVANDRRSFLAELDRKVTSRIEFAQEIKSNAMRRPNA